MRDGEFTLYRVQHKDSRGWHASDLGNFLFHNDPRGEKGDRFSAVIQAQHDCWQRTGQHAGYDLIVDARLALETVRAERPDHKFRLVRMRMSQVTEVVE